MVAVLAFMVVAGCGGDRGNSVRVNALWYGRTASGEAGAFKTACLHQIGTFLGFSAADLDDSIRHGRHQAAATPPEPVLPASPFTADTRSWVGPRRAHVSRTPSLRIPGIEMRGRRVLGAGSSRPTSGLDPRRHPTRGLRARPGRRRDHRRRRGLLTPDQPSRPPFDSVAATPPPNLSGGDSSIHLPSENVRRYAEGRTLSDRQTRGSACADVHRPGDPTNPPPSSSPSCSSSSRSSSSTSTSSSTSHCEAVHGGAGSLPCCWSTV